VEILTNPSAGPLASATVQTILTEVVEDVSRAMSERIVSALEAHNVQIFAAMGGGFGGAGGGRGHGRTAHRRELHKIRTRDGAEAVGY
jgi:hypothetical protein